MREEFRDFIRTALKPFSEGHNSAGCLGSLALALSVYQHWGIDLGRYEFALEKLRHSVFDRYQNLLSAGADDDAGTKLAALKYVFIEEQSFVCDPRARERIDSYSLINFLDRRAGADILLAMLYLSTGRRLGWSLDWLHFPGACLLGLQEGAQRFIFSPAGGCERLNAPDLRRMIKDALGASAELSSSYFESLNDQEILVSLQNQLKFRFIEVEDYAAALDIVDITRLIAPGEYRLLLDEGVLCTRTGDRQRAIRALRSYIARAPLGKTLEEARLLLSDISGSGSLDGV